MILLLIPAIPRDSLLSNPNLYKWWRAPDKRQFASAMLGQETQTAGTGYEDYVDYFYNYSGWPVIEKCLILMSPNSNPRSQIPQIKTNCKDKSFLLNCLRKRN